MRLIGLIIVVGACHGNIVSDGRRVQSQDLQMTNFGLRKDGTIVVGYVANV